MARSMANTEAVEILKTAKAEVEWEYPMDYCIAIDKAIRALERDDSDGCINCAFESVEEWELPCVQCKRNSRDYWRHKA